MKVLFLDIDGVLHDASAAEIEYTETGIQITGSLLFQRLPLLEELMNRCLDVSLLISSSWQEHYSLDELRGFLGAAGSRVIGSSRSMNAARELAGNRYEECQAAANSISATQWVIVDDQPAIVWGSRVPTREEMARVVLCDPVLGLTPRVVDILARKLS